MNIVYLHQYFMPSEGVRSFEFIKHLCRQGHKVTVITALECDEVFGMDNLTVVSTHTKYNNNMSKAKRIISFAKYMFKATGSGLKCKNTDLVFATSTPLTIGFPAVIIKKLKRCKMIFEVRDVWPDIPIEMGFIKNPLVKKMLKAFEMHIYKNAAHIIPLSEGMRDNLLRKGVQSEKLTVIENISNRYLYGKLDDILEIREQQPAFVCIHPGTMGFVNGLDFVLDTAKVMLKEDGEVKFLLVGEGNQKERLKKRVEQEKITNVEIRDAVPKREVAKLTEKAALGFMCVDTKYKILEDNSANKFFDFLAAGLPIIINYNGWQKKFVESNKCGFSAVTPEDAAKIIKEIKDKKDLAKTYAANSYSAADRFSTESATEKLDIILQNI